MPPTAFTSASRAFELLRTEEDRIEALRLIIAQLNDSECALVRQVISDRRDIFLRLPPELLLHIFLFLPIESTWTLQLVCRRWRSTLNSSRFRMAAICRWDTHDPADAAAFHERFGVDTIENKVRHMVAVQAERPFLFRELTDPDLKPSSPRWWQTSRVALKGSRIAYLAREFDGRTDTVVVRELTSTRRWTFGADGRGEITRFILTSHIIAFVSSTGRLYVAEIELEPPDQRCIPMQSHRLPSVMICAMGGDGHTLFVVHSITSGHCNSTCVDFKASSSTTVSFPVSAPGRDGIDKPLDRDAHAVEVLVDCQTRSCNLFYYCYADTSEPRDPMLSDWVTGFFVHIRWHFDGRLSPSSFYPLPRLCACNGDDVDNGLMMIALPCGYRGHCFLISSCIHHERETEIMLFDYGNPGRHPSSPFSDVNHQIMRRARHSTQVWKGISSSTPPYETSTFSNTASTIRGTNNDYYLCNDIFAIYVGEDKVSSNPDMYAFCFDENVRMPLSSSTGLWEAPRTADCTVLDSVVDDGERKRLPYFGQSGVPSSKRPLTYPEGATF